ncbi:hypothetical protein Z043_116880 [Scleropages formosus]|uniref:Photoreceptor cilium actin regulator-like n=1 Tax=Scleropages formosus TaxID=113540 RepID=A0A0P7YEH5_SCLFO|nr:hypothetical protein Z043_116880 [Scleropages formosus]
MRKAKHCFQAPIRVMQMHSQKTGQAEAPLIQGGRMEKVKKEKLEEAEGRAHSKEILGDDEEDKQEKRGGRKTRKSKGNKAMKKRDKEKKSVEQKFDFPEPLVKAHQAAYAYLNPNISKYDVLLTLLDQITQTQLSLQPMATFMVLRYEEVNRALSDIADEGEKMLKNNGEHLAWPCPLKNLSANVIKIKETGSTTDSPPDLLQQLLQYTTQRMQMVSHSVGSIVDSALQEAVDYFASLSELLEEKLKAKQATEARLTRVLARIESAAVRRPSPDDSALYSEDSGIGADSWSLAESEHRRESLDSIGTVRPRWGTRDSVGTPAKRASSRRKLRGNISPSLSLNSVDSTCTLIATESLLGSASLDESDGEDKKNKEGDKEVEEQDKDGKVNGREQANSLPLDPCRTPRRLPIKRIENPQNVEMTLKMKDAISGRIRFVPSHRHGPKPEEKNSNGKGSSHWLEEEERQSKRPQSAAPAASPRRRTRPTQTKQHRSRSAESLRTKAEDPTLLELERTQKDLSQRLEKMTAGRSVEADKGTIHRRGGTQQHPNPQGCQGSSKPRNLSTSPKQERARFRRHSSGEKGASTEKEERKEKENKAETGPVLMDNSFETAQEPASVNNGDRAGSKGRSPLLQRATISQRLRASVQPVAVLPSRAWPVQQDDTIESKGSQLGVEPQSQEAVVLYEQSRKIIHLQCSTELPTEKNPADTRIKKASTTRYGGGVKQTESSLSESVSSTSPVNIPSQTPATPPISRARMLPSTPSNASSQNRRLPSPPVFKRQPTPPTSTSPSPSRKLPTPPSGQRTQPSPSQLPKTGSSPSSQWKAPSPPLSKQDVTPNTTSYPFKNPSPPASPRVQKWSRDNTSMDSSWGLCAPTPLGGGMSGQVISVYAESPTFYQT